MNKKEFSIIIMEMQTAYPKEKLFENSAAIDFWYKMLGDISYESMSMALTRWVATNMWPPTIANLREYAAKADGFHVKDYGEAWQDVLRAISNYGFYREEQALDSLDEITRAAVQRLGFKNICMTENIVSDRAQFKSIYETLALRQKEDAQVPEIVRDAIQQMRANALEG